jgi:hypothetical protein
MVLKKRVKSQEKGLENWKVSLINSKRNKSNKLEDWLNETLSGSKSKQTVT